MRTVDTCAERGVYVSPPKAVAIRRILARRVARGVLIVITCGYGFRAVIRQLCHEGNLHLEGKKSSFLSIRNNTQRYIKYLNTHVTGL